MRYQQFNERYIIRLQTGESVMTALGEFLAAEGIEFTNINAAGALEYVRLGYWNPISKQYEYHEFEEQLEVVSLLGNAALKDGKPFLHIHGSFGRQNFTVIGGHVKEARVRPTLEVWLRTENLPVRRTKDPATGLDLLDLPEPEDMVRIPFPDKSISETELDADDFI